MKRKTREQKLAEALSYMIVVFDPQENWRFSMSQINTRQKLALRQAWKTLKAIKS